MDAARPRDIRRRPRRGSVDRPLNTRLVRSSALVLVLPLLLAAFSVSRPGPLPAPALPPSFDETAALSLTRALAEQWPSRLPGSVSDERAADWVAETLSSYGLTPQRDTWTQHVPGLGPVTLENLVVVVPGSARGAIAFVADRDTSGTGSGANDGASGTATLIQLARAYGAAGTAAKRPQPLHTLVFVSADAGAFGGLGAARFASTRHDLLAAVVLGGLAGPGRPRLELAGDGGRTAAPALVRTASARVEEQTGARLRLPGLLRQLVDLAVPFAYGDQAPFLGARVSAVRLTTADDSGRAATADTVAALDAGRLGQLGAAAQNILGSLDAAAELAPGTGSALVLQSRVVHGWALVLVSIGALIPFLVGVVDLLARLRRLGLPLAPAARALRRRAGYWLWLALLVWLAAAAGLLPNAPGRPLPPAGETARHWPVAALLVVGALGLAGWFGARRRLAPSDEVEAGEELAGYAAALGGLGFVAVAVAIVHPLALVLVLPSLYAWLWLPQVASRPWLRDVVFAVGLSGAVLVAVSIGSSLGLGLRTPLYLVLLVSTGYVSWVTVLLAVGWAATAAQLAALAAGRYAPYAGGARHPPRGVVRDSVRRAVRAAQSRRR